MGGFPEGHVVHVEDDGTALLYIDRHLVHEVTSPQAFEGLKLAGRKPWRISSIVATADHNTPTSHWERGILDPMGARAYEIDAMTLARAVLAMAPVVEAARRQLSAWERAQTNPAGGYGAWHGRASDTDDAIRTLDAEARRG